MEILTSEVNTCLQEDKVTNEQLADDGLLKFPFQNASCVFLYLYCDLYNV